MRRVYYVHGFASSSRSTKAALFNERLAPAGLELRCPDFNQPAFETLTVSRSIAQLEADIAALPAGPVALIGSSLGGFVAFLAVAAQATRIAAGEVLNRPIDRLVLLAPALDFGRTEYGTYTAEQIAAWRETRRMEVFHYGDGRTREIGYELVEDAQRYDALAERLSIPTLVFQGTRDAAVNPAMVRAYCAMQPAASLRLFDDDHQLTESITTIVRETAAFLGVP